MRESEREEKEKLLLMYECFYIFYEAALSAHFDPALFIQRLWEKTENDCTCKLVCSKWTCIVIAMLLGIWKHHV